MEIGRNSPRMPSGASGLRSKLSSCDRPPDRKMKITERARGPVGLALEAGRTARGIGTLRRLASEGTERLQMVHPQPQDSDRTRLDRDATTQPWMPGELARPTGMKRVHGSLSKSQRIACSGIVELKLNHNSTIETMPLSRVAGLKSASVRPSRRGVSSMESFAWRFQVTAKCSILVRHGGSRFGT